MVKKSEPVKIRLRETEPADLEQIFEDQRDPTAVAMVVFKSRDRAAFDEHWATHQADETYLCRTITVGDDNHFAGFIATFNRNGVREIGYWITRSFWGLGIATAALQQFVAIEPIRPLYAGVAKHNTGSLRVLHKCGFKVVEREPAPVPLGSTEETPRIILRLDSSPG